ncbi:MAG: alpha/beta hydrolase [Oscillospiraceae bacterium]
MLKFIKVAAIVLLILLAVILIAGFVAGNYFYTLALARGSDKTAITKPTDNAIDIPNPNAESNKAWFDSVGRTDAYMESRDGLKLHAYFILNTAGSNNWVVIAHGYGGSGATMNATARSFYEMGFNVLLPDARGHGESEGDYIGMGWPDRLDIVDWLNRLVAEQGDIEIVLYGVSMGGATVMMVSGEELPPNVKVIVEDCGYTSVRDEFAYQLKSIWGLPGFPILNFADAVTRMRAGYSFFDASAVAQVEKSVTPMLFIHGSEDTFVPTYMLDIVYDAANVEKEKLLVAGASHGTSYLVGGELYWDTIKEFTGRFLNAPPWE